MKPKTQLEKELQCIVDIYHQYSFRNPIDDYLQKGEFKKLLKEQAADFLRNTKPVSGSGLGQLDVQQCWSLEVPMARGGRHLARPWIPPDALGP